MAVVLKSSREIALIRKAGSAVARGLEYLRNAVRPGMSTAELDELAAKFLQREGMEPSFKGYHGFPACLCVSVDDEVVHGIPRPDRVLREGNIVGLDFGAIYEGFHADAAITVPVRKVSAEAIELIRVTEEALMEAIRHARCGSHLGDISSAIQQYVERHGYSVVRQYVGHGIGRSLHEDPQVPNFGVPGYGPKLKPGTTLAIEPMVNQGDFRTVVREDQWTVVTADGSLSAHFEHTIAITEDGPTILTLP